MSIGEHKSKWTSLTCGVPQGSIIALLLFSLYMRCRISETESDKSRFDQNMVETLGVEFHKKENKTTAGSQKSDPACLHTAKKQASFTEQLATLRQNNTYR